MSPTTTETLLRASIELLQLRKQIEDLTDANERLRAQVNRREFDLSCDEMPLSIFHRRQAE